MIKHQLANSKLLRAACRNPLNQNVEKHGRHGVFAKQNGD
jgi:hypothetical protein